MAIAAATAAETQKHSQSQQEAAGEQEKKGSGSRISRVGSSVKKKKTRRSCSSLDGYSVPAIIINEKQVMSNRGTVPFRRSSSLSAEIGNSKLGAAAFGVERQQCAFQSPRNKGLVVPWILRNRNISRNRRKGVTNTDSKSRQADDGRGPFKQNIVQEEEEEEEEEEISYDDDESKPEESEDETPSARLNRYHYHHHCDHTRCHETISTDLSSSSCSKGNNGLCLSDKYKPKRFEDILGHQINVMALSSAIKKEKVAPLYLFHGPGGTGKSCVARIFSMACNCESPWPSKPCWSCRGCSRGVYMKELCFSGTRSCSSSFHQLRALLQSTAFFSGLKVFVFEEFHSFSPQDWEELLLMSELGSMAFVLVVDDPNRVPNSVTSRCHKFGFQKLKDVDIALKLARIVACEGLRIEKDALRLITGKAHGSLREAENILDQLALLGTRITTSMVRQLVGLVAQDELIGLLDTAMSADAIKTVRQTRELIETGIEPQALLTQLASLITDLISLSGASSTLYSSKHKSWLRNQSLHQLAKSVKSQSSQILCHALSILIETERQMQSSTSSEQATTWLVSSLLQIASYRTHSGSTDIVLPQDFFSSTNEDLASTTTSVQQTRQNFGQINGNGLSVLGHQIKNKSPHNFGDVLVSNKTINSSQECVEGMINLADQITDMEQVWNNILARIQSQNVRDFLHHQGRLNSLTVSRANAIVHLMFKGQEDKIVAENSEETISAALKLALGCPVTVNISLQPMQLESINKRLSASANDNHDDGDRFHARQITPTFLPTNSEQPLASDGRQHDLRHSASASQRSGSILSESHASRSRLHDNIETPNAQQQLLQVDTHLHDTLANTSVSIPKLVTHIPSMAMGTQSQIQDKIPIMTSISHRKPRLVSLSSIQQTEASVEPYSQDLLFENANTDRLKGTSRNSNIHRGFTKAKEHEQQTASFVGFNRSWSCTNRICRSKTMKDDVQHSTRGDYK